MSKYICNFEPFAGKELIDLNECYGYNDNNLSFSVAKKAIPDLIQRGLITEVKPAVWTDDDMIEFGNISKIEMCKGYAPVESLLRDFKKEKGI